MKNEDGSVDYKKIIDFILISGKRLRERAGKIKDIGISKTDLTEEDLKIERGLKEIISSFGENHLLYAEEENTMFQKSDNVWVADPISGTANFIKGNPHYSIVISHLVKNETVFAAVYDPSIDELYTAYKNKGAFLNGQAIQVGKGIGKILFRESGGWKQPEIIAEAKNILKDFVLEENKYSMAINYCWVAAGRYDGVVSFTKDSFPEFAGGFIIKESGGKFTNLREEATIKPSDRIFIGGNKDEYLKLISLIRNIV